MAQFPDYMDATEQRICNAMLTKILTMGHYVRVHDGEEWQTGWTRDRGHIQFQTGATDETLYHIADRNEGENNWTRLGWIRLIHGNGEDVVSDCGAPNGPALEYIESLTRI